MSDLVKKIEDMKFIEDSARAASPGPLWYSGLCVGYDLAKNDAIHFVEEHKKTAQPEWIKISDRMPTTDDCYPGTDKVWVFWSNAVINITRVGVLWDDETGRDILKPISWLPIQAPPHTTTGD